jgi:hypothetical protein
MFVVTEEDEAAIRAVYERRGEFAAAVELRATVLWHRRQRAVATILMATESTAQGSAVG